LTPPFAAHDPHTTTLVRDGALKSCLSLPSTTSASSRFKILLPRPHCAAPHLIAALFQELHSTDLIIDSDNFARLVAEIGQDFVSDLMWEVDAVLALQTAAEDYLTGLFEVRGLSCRVVDREWLRRADTQRCRAEYAHLIHAANETAPALLLCRRDGITFLFQDSKLNAIHASRQEIRTWDLHLSRRVRGERA
jgi:histone H3/H4